MSDIKLKSNLEPVFNPKPEFSNLDQLALGFIGWFIVHGLIFFLTFLLLNSALMYLVYFLIWMNVGVMINVNIAAIVICMTRPRWRWYGIGLLSAITLTCFFIFLLFIFGHK